MVTDGLRGHQPLARLHPCQMHPCQLLLLALHSDSTRIIMALLTHEILALNDPIRKQSNGGFGSVAVIGIISRRMTASRLEAELN